MSLTKGRRMWSTNPDILSVEQRFALTMGRPSGGVSYKMYFIPEITLKYFLGRTDHSASKLIVYICMQDVTWTPQ